MNRIGYGNQIITDGLVLHLDAANPQSYDGNSNIWRDLSGNNLHATLYNGTGYNNSNKGNILFDGVDDYGIIPASDKTILSTLTLEICFNRTQIATTTTPYDRIFQKNGGYSGAPVIGYHLGEGDPSGLILGISFGSLITDNIFININTLITIGQWYYVSTTIDTLNNLKNYVNGQFVTSTLNTLPQPIYQNNNTFTIAVGDDREFAGKFSSIKLYNRSLSQNEILQNYNVIKNRFI